MKQRIISAAAMIFIATAVAPNLALAKATDYKATVHLKKPGEGRKKIVGFVFEDLNKDGKFNN